MARIPAAQRVQFLRGLGHRAIRVLCDDARLHDAQQMHALFAQALRQLAACAVWKGLFVPAKLAKMILSPCLVIKIQPKPIQRNMFIAVGFHNRFQLALGNAPLAVDEPQRPFWQHGRAASQRGHAVYQCLWPAHHYKKIGDGALVEFVTQASGVGLKLPAHGIYQHAQPRRKNPRAGGVSLKRWFYCAAIGSQQAVFHAAPYIAGAHAVKLRLAVQDSDLARQVCDPRQKFVAGVVYPHFQRAALNLHAHRPGADAGQRCAHPRGQNFTFPARRGRGWGGRKNQRGRNGRAGNADRIRPDHIHLQTGCAICERDRVARAGKTGLRRSRIFKGKTGLAG